MRRIARDLSVGYFQEIQRVSATANFGRRRVIRWKYADGVAEWKWKRPPTKQFWPLFLFRLCAFKEWGARRRKTWPIINGTVCAIQFRNQRLAGSKLSMALQTFATGRRASRKWGRLHNFSVEETLFKSKWAVIYFDMFGQFGKSSIT